MAESAVSYAIQRLDSFVVGEVRSQRGFKREMESLKNELDSINTVLKDADRKAYVRTDIKGWLKQIREMAYKIEDVMDKYLAIAPNSHRHELAATEDESKDFKLRMKSMMVKVVQWIRVLKARHQLATTIKEITEDLAKIHKRKENYQLVSTTSEEEHEQRQGCQDFRTYYSTYLEHSELLGIDKPKSNIIRMLKMEHQPFRRFVIAMVGMGGVGKTTLVQKVYEDKEVKKHFRLHAWVSVSQSYKKMDILRSVSKQLLESVFGREGAAHEVDNLSEERIIPYLRDFLQKQQQHNKRYLVVLDDIWDRQLLDSIKDTLPSDLDGRILMTTRNRDVAITWTNTLSGDMHEVKPLSPNEAWDLFCRKTFIKKDCPQDLEDLSRQIVEKCEGLPLAIVAIGGFLSTKQVGYPIWSKLLKSLGTELTSNTELTSVTRILLLSYHELPYYLKPCFLYFGMFPEDYSIAHRRIIRIWIAEGLVKPQRGKKIEEVAEEYFTELIQRNLLQITSANATGKHTLIRVHDILREIIISELEETEFDQPVSKENMSMNNQNRRLIISNSNMLKSIGNKSKIRCLIYMNNKEEVPRVLIISLLVKVMPLLKVLDLQDAPIDEIPEEVGNLRLLRLLNLRKTNVKTLPKSIGQLVNLETLDMRRCPIRELPKEMSHLYKLRYIRAWSCVYYKTTGALIEHEGVKIPRGVLENLKQLQKVTFIENGGETTTEAEATTILQEVRNLKELRKLGIRYRKENEVELSSILQQMKHLESLSVGIKNMDDIMDLQLDGKNNNRSIQCLYMIKGLMHKLPGWVAQLDNLVTFGFMYSRLQEDPLPILQHLPNLVQLWLLEDAYEGEQLDLGISGFQKLQLLDLIGLKGLKRIKGSTPPLLQTGYIYKCPMVEDVPLGMQFMLRS